MANFVIGYDLNRPGQNYDTLIDAIKNVGSNWWHCLDSTWIVVTTKTSVQVRDLLTPHLDTNDELLVMRLPDVPDAAWRGFNTQCSDWLKNNL